MNRKTFPDWRILLGLALGALTPANSATFRVEIRDYDFVPATHTISVGDTVTWTNRDDIQHTATESTGIWDSGLLSRGETFSHTFHAVGTFDYFCGPHPFMAGTIVVEEASGIPPLVEITSPTNHTVLPAPGSLLVEATATATGTHITQVEFFDGASLVGTDTTEPFSVTLNLTAGIHLLTAKATDGHSATTTSPAVTVTVQGGGTPIDDPIPAKIPKGDRTIELQTIAEGLISPLGMAGPHDGSGRIFVYDQAGLIYVWVDGVRLSENLLDVRDRLVALNPNYDERGLLGAAPHPQFGQNQLLYTYTSEPNGPPADFMIMPPEGRTNNHQSVIAEWRIDPANTNRVDPASRREILRLDQPQSNHNGGTIRFGPDGFLYIATGDGGAADDQGDGHSPGGNGQDKRNVLGKVLRIDVDARTAPNGQYGVPADNPFLDETGTPPEIYAYGFRNPYSFSFDRQAGDLWLADVGQNHVEEIDRVTKGGNFGWPIKEGGFFFDPNGASPGFVTTEPVREVPDDLIDPVGQYDHDEGVAVIGGYVYRGTLHPDLAGVYLAGDWGAFSAPTGRLFYLENAEVKEFHIGLDDRSLGLWLKGFGEDSSGELYLFGATNLGPSGSSGRMLKIVPPVPPAFSITEISVEDNALVLSWTNGASSFRVQKKSALGDAEWVDVKTVTETTTTVPMDDEAAFLRVVTP